MKDDRKKPGPEPIYEEAMRFVGLRLPPHLIEKAKRIGDGKISAGIRLVLEEVSE